MSDGAVGSVTPGRNLERGLALRAPWRDALSLESLARMPLRKRRWLLRAAFLAREFARPTGGLGGLETFRRALNLSKRSALRLERDILFHDRLQSLEWRVLAQGNPAGFKADARHVEVADEELFVQIARTRRPVVLAPLHMGVYTLCLGAIVARYFGDRRIVVLRSREDLLAETAAMERIAEVSQGVTLLNAGRREDLVQLARQGKEGAVCVCFLDLPESYGAATQVELFRARAKMAFGAARLAKMIDGLLAPMAVRSRLTGDEVMTGQAYETVDADPERLSASLGRQVQAFIEREPAQWHMWPRIGEYFLSTTVEDASHAD